MHVNVWSRQAQFAFVTIRKAKTWRSSHIVLSVHTSISFWSVSTPELPMTLSVPGNFGLKSETEYGWKFTNCVTTWSEKNRKIFTCWIQSRHRCLRQTRRQLVLLIDRQLPYTNQDSISSIHPMPFVHARLWVALSIRCDKAIHVRNKYQRKTVRVYFVSGRTSASTGILQTALATIRIPTGIHATN